MGFEPLHSRSMYPFHYTLSFFSIKINNLFHTSSDSLKKYIQNTEPQISMSFPLILLLQFSFFLFSGFLILFLSSFGFSLLFLFLISFFSFPSFLIFSPSLDLEIDMQLDMLNHNSVSVTTELIGLSWLVNWKFQNGRRRDFSKIDKFRSDSVLDEFYTKPVWGQP